MSRNCGVVRRATEHGRPRHVPPFRPNWAALQRSCRSTRRGSVWLRTRNPSASWPLAWASFTTFAGRLLVEPTPFGSISAQTAALFGQTCPIWKRRGACNAVQVDWTRTPSATWRAWDRSAWSSPSSPCPRRTGAEAAGGPARAVRVADDGRRTPDGRVAPPEAAPPVAEPPGAAEHPRRSPGDPGVERLCWRARLRRGCGFGHAPERDGS